MDAYRQYVYTQLQGVNKDPDFALEQYAWFIAELQKWNKSVNLTSITEENACWEKHIQDSLLPLPYVCKADNLLDLGSGAGLPAIPLKISCPDMHVVSVDKVRKKINFQNHCKRSLHLNKFEAICADIGDLEQYSQAFDVVVARALASLEILIRLGAGYIKPGGTLLALKSRMDEAELEAGKCAAKAFNLELKQVEHVRLKPSGAERKLIMIRRN